MYQNTAQVWRRFDLLSLNRNRECEDRPEFPTFTLQLGILKSYGHVSVLSCSSKDELLNGLVTIDLSSGLTYYYVCLNGFNQGAVAAVCRQLGYTDAVPVLVDGEQKFFGPPDVYGYVHHFTSLFSFLVN